MRIFLPRLGFVVLTLVLAGNIATATASAATPHPQASPTPKPKAGAPHHVVWSGYQRDFYFARQNASAYPKGSGQINQAAFESAEKLHGEYTLPAGDDASSPWTVGSTYVFASPLGLDGPCAAVSAYGAHGGCQEYPTATAQYKHTDTTLPAFPLATLSEAWVQYKANGLNVKAGDQLFQSPWAGPSDTRVKQAFYQGADAHYALADGWSVQVARITAWESRSSSDFNQSTLITLNSNGTYKPTPGFLLGNIAYSRSAAFTADANYYEFYNIANLLWVEGKWSFGAGSSWKPFVAAHVAAESSTGKALVGIVQSQMEGVQAGVSVAPNLTLTAGFDHVPVESATVDLPHGTTCSSKTHVISGTLDYFLPTSGTPNCVPITKTTAAIYYGGIASPYTDGYTSDPSFTTSISQGLMERQSPGDALKLVGTYLSGDRRVKLIISQAYYDYTNPAGPEFTEEFDADATIYLTPNTGPVYHGFSLRDRYMGRNQDRTGIYGGTPLFKANRTQLEYDF